MRCFLLLLRAAAFLACAAVALLWARSHGGAIDWLAGSSDDAEVRRTITVSSFRGLVTLAISHDAPGGARAGNARIGVRYWREPADGPFVSPVPPGMATHAGFAWHHRPRTGGMPPQAAWTFAVVPWWFLAATLAIAILLFESLRRVRPAARVAPSAALTEAKTSDPHPPQSLSLAA